VPLVSRPLERGCAGGRRSIQSLEQMVTKVAGAVLEEENWSNGYREPVLGANHSTPPAEPARSVFMIWCVKGQIAWSNSRCATVFDNWTSSPFCFARRANYHNTLTSYFTKMGSLVTNVASSTLPAQSVAGQTGLYGAQEALPMLARVRVLLAKPEYCFSVVGFQQSQGERELQFSQLKLDLHFPNTCDAE